MLETEWKNLSSKQNKVMPKLNINWAWLIIDSQRYPMIVKRTDEFQYREAARLLNDRLNVYRESYPDIGIIKQWAMTAYDMAFDAVTYKSRNDTKSYKDKLEELGKQLDEYLK